MSRGGPTARGCAGAGIALLALLAIGGCSRPGTPRVAVREAWSRPTPEGSRVGVLYMTLESNRDDRLVGVEIPAAVGDHAEMHETTTDAAGAMSMHHVDAIALRAGRAVELRPGGNHVMLMGLAAPLVAGDTLDVELRFDRAPPLPVRVPVRGD